MTEGEEARITKTEATGHCNVKPWDNQRVLWIKYGMEAKCKARAKCTKRSKISQSCKRTKMELIREE